MTKKVRKRRLNRKLASVACAVLLGIGAVSAGFYAEPPGELIPVEVVHVVKAQETLWGICATYYEKDVGGGYLLEYQEQVKAANPWLKDRHGQLQPGDELKISYKIKKPTSVGADMD